MWPVSLFFLKEKYIYIYIYIYISGPLVYRVECSSMVRETGIQSQVESYQRLKKLYLMQPCLTLSIIRYRSRVKWNNPENEVAPSSTPLCSSPWEGTLGVANLYICRVIKWYLIPPCLTLSNIRYVSRVKWNNPEKGVAPSPESRCCSYWKGSLLVTLDYGRQLAYI